MTVTSEINPTLPLKFGRMDIEVIKAEMGGEDRKLPEEVLTVKMALFLQSFGSYRLLGGNALAFIKAHLEIFGSEIIIPEGSEYFEKSLRSFVDLFGSNDLREIEKMIAGRAKEFPDLSLLLAYDAARMGSLKGREFIEAALGAELPLASS